MPRLIAGPPSVASPGARPSGPAGAGRHARSPSAPAFRPPAPALANAIPADCVLIGDSLADIDGAHAAGVAVIGYANRPEKLDRFTDAHPDVVITSMVEVANALVELRI